MCLHKRNVSTIRDTVRLLGSLGVQRLKIGIMMDLGEWAQQDVKELYIGQDEINKAFCDYIPQYFEDDAPVDIMLGGGFTFYRNQGPWSIFHVHKCPAEDESRVPSCGALL